MARVRRPACRTPSSGRQNGVRGAGRGGQTADNGCALAGAARAPTAQSNRSIRVADHGCDDMEVVVADVGAVERR